MSGDFKDFQCAFGDIESVFKTLEAVSQKYPESSDEHKAIEIAAKALGFAFTEQLQNSFKSFLENICRPLTEKERDHLKSMNIDPDTGQWD